MFIYRNSYNQKLLIDYFASSRPLSIDIPSGFGKAKIEKIIMGNWSKHNNKEAKIESLLRNDIFLNWRWWEI